MLGSDTYAARARAGPRACAGQRHAGASRNGGRSGQGQRISAGGDLELSAKETITITGTAGGLGAGAVGVGASIDYARLESDTRVMLGDGAVAQPRARRP